MNTRKIEKVFEESVRESGRVILSVLRNIPEIKEACESISSAFSKGGKVLIFGNGGSAADAQHFSAEFVGKFRSAERKALPAIALTVDTSALTAISNDWNFDYVFERQIEALGRKGDIAVGISTSGKSKNVLRALRKAKEIGMKTIGLTGKNKKEMEKVCDIVIGVDSDDTQRIQEAHGLIIHLICEGIELIETGYD